MKNDALFEIRIDDSKANEKSNYFTSSSKKILNNIFIILSSIQIKKKFSRNNEIELLI